MVMDGEGKDGKEEVNKNIWDQINLIPDVGL